MNRAPAKQASAEQRAAADPNASVWVSANAGSGKTHVLIDRVTRLLLDGADPGRILCLSFTKAAAAEMEERLYQRLGSWATLPDPDLLQELRTLQERPLAADDLRRARKLFARALETPGGLKIRTIHAFCESLLRRFPLEAGIARHFEVLDDRTAIELRHAARVATLARAQTNDDPSLRAALEFLVRLIDEPAFIDLTNEALYQKAAAEQNLEAQQAALFAYLDIAQGVSRDDMISTYAAELPASNLRRAAEALQKGSDKDKARADAILRYLDSKDAAGEFETYRQVFLTQKNEPQKSIITKPAQKHDAGAGDILRDEQQRIFLFMQRLLAVQVAQSSAAALRIGAAVRADYQLAKTRRAALDYDDLIRHTQQLLQAQGAAWVHYKLDEGIDHILVDEAQDTSTDQWNIIRHLSDEFFSGKTARGENRESKGLGPRTLFAVGDEKQSIFSFQGADPASFAAMREYFSGRAQAAGLVWRDVTLQQSFRSTPQILSAVDTVFAAPSARDGLTADDAIIRHTAARGDHPGLVEIWPPIAPQPATPPQPWDAPVDALPARSPRALLAQRIVDHIEKLLKDGQYMPSTRKAVQPDDIIILVRTRNEFVDECIRQLKIRNIPVAGADRMMLLDQMAVMDLMAAGHFVLLPEDDLNLAALLRSPFIGITEDQLFALAHGRAQPRLWDALRSRHRENPDFSAAYEILADLLKQADHIPPHEFFARLLGPMGGRRKLLSRLGPDANDPIDEFLSLTQLYERAHAPSLQGFLHWLGGSQTQIKRDMEQGSGAVRVMTVHAAKGLEAPIVYLPDTCSMPDGKFDPKLIPVEGEDFYLWPVRKGNDDPKTAAQRERTARAREREYRRLLYVAMTRPKDWLFVCGYKGERELADGCWHRLIETALAPMAEKFTLPWGEEGLRIKSGGASAVAASAPAAAATPQALPAWAHQPAPPEPLPSRPLAPSRPQAEDATVRSPRHGASSEHRFKRGRLIHQLLQYLPDLAIAKRQAAAIRYLSQAAFALSPPDVEEIAAQAMRVLENPDFAPAFGPGSQAEAAIAGLVPALGPGIVLSGQIDRLLVGADEILIIDYKTHRPPPLSAADVPQIYLQQMAAYRAALHAIYPAHGVRCALIWTDVPLLMPLSDAQLDLALPAT
ncbi:unnamed protein product [Phaeothamnion confervicola]